MENMVVCEDWHEDCIVVVQSQQLARKISGMLPCLKICQCSEMINMKGIVVGRRERSLPMQASIKTYMLNYYRQKMVLTDNNA